MDHRTFLKTLVAGASPFALAPLLGGSSQASVDSLFLDVRTLGARGDGRADDLPALMQAGEIAASTGRYISLPAGVYRIDGPLSWVDVPGVVGVPDHSVIRSTVTGGAAVALETRISALGATPSTVVSGLTVDGSLSQARSGLVIGAGGLSGRVVLSDCVVHGFKASGAAGITVRSVVQGTFQRVLVTRNSTNVLVEGPTPDLPTTVTFESCNVREAIGPGLVVRGGYGLRFRGCVFESNGDEGALIAPSAGRTILLCTFEDAWFENNSRRDSLAFACDADGSAASSTCNPIFLRCLFTTQRLRALRLRNATNFLVDTCRFPQVMGCVVVEGAHCHGTFANFQRFAGDFSTLVDVTPELRNAIQH